MGLASSRELAGTPPTFTAGSYSTAFPFPDVVGEAGRWGCEYCQMSNPEYANFCLNCGAPRKDSKIKMEEDDDMYTPDEDGMRKIFW